MEIDGPTRQRHHAGRDVDLNEMVGTFEDRVAGFPRQRIMPIQRGASARADNIGNPVDDRSLIIMIMASQYESDSVFLEERLKIALHLPCPAMKSGAVHWMMAEKDFQRTVGILEILFEEFVLLAPRFVFHVRV